MDPTQIAAFAATFLDNGCIHMSDLAMADKLEPQFVFDPEVDTADTAFIVDKFYCATKNEKGWVNICANPVVTFNEHNGLAFA
jgi:hypothetical protein